MKVTIEATMINEQAFSFSFLGQTIRVTPYNHPDIFYQIAEEWKRLRDNMSSKDLAKEIIEDGKEKE